MNREISDEMYIYDLSVRQWETFEQQIILQDEDGNLIDLRNKTAQAQVRPEPGSSTKTADMTCTVDTSNGSVIFRLTSSQTAGIAVGKYYYDLCILETVSGETIRKYLIGGKFNVLPSVTH